MQIRNPVVCDTGQSKEAYISNKPTLVVEHAFPLTWFVCLLANATPASNLHGSHMGNHMFKNTI